MIFSNIWVWGTKFFKNLTGLEGFLPIKVIEKSTIYNKVRKDGGEGDCSIFQIRYE